MIALELIDIIAQAEATALALLVSYWNESRK